VNGLACFLIGAAIGTLVTTGYAGLMIDQHCVCDAAAEPCRTPSTVRP
jgi:hypothetical protein